MSKQEIWIHAGAGSLLDLCMEMKEAVRIIGKICAKYNQKLYITHITAGIHGNGSMHPFGRAIDFRYPNIISNIRMVKFRRDLKYALNVPGPVLPGYLGHRIKYDIVYHDTHIHVEFDPKPED